MEMIFDKQIKRKKKLKSISICDRDLWKSTIHNGRDANSLVEGLTNILQAFAHWSPRHCLVSTTAAAYNVIRIGSVFTLFLFCFCQLIHVWFVFVWYVIYVWPNNGFYLRFFRFFFFNINMRLSNNVPVPNFTIYYPFVFYLYFLFIFCVDG